MFKVSHTIYLIANLALLLGTNLLWGQQSDKSWEKIIKIKNEKNINTELSEFSPSYFNDYIVYVGSNQRQKKQAKIENAYFDLYFSGLNKKARLDKPSSLDNRINTIYNEGPASFTQNGKYCYFTRVDYDGSGLTMSPDKTVTLQIFESEYKNGGWNNPIKTTVNKDQVPSCHPVLNKVGTVMIFASDRKGGYGKMDLYISYKNDQGKWGEPENLGPEINSAGNDWFPHLHSANILFYASTGDNKEGDLNVYTSEFKSNKWTNPMVLPYPINTRYDDFGLITDGDGMTGYYSSNRPGGQGGDDVYSYKASTSIFSYANPDYNKLLLDIKDNESLNPITDGIIRYRKINDIELESFTSDIFSFSKIAYDSILIDPNKPPSIHLHGGSTLIEVESFNKEKWQIVLSNKKHIKTLEVLLKTHKKPIKIQSEFDSHQIVDIKPKEDPKGLMIGQTIIFDNIKFDYNSSELTNVTKKELDGLVDLMKNNPNVIIQLSCHTDSRGNAGYNTMITDQRAEVIRAYLITHGVNAVHVIAIGRGETRPRNHCSKGVKCSENEHAFNRRMEVKIVEN